MSARSSSADFFAFACGGEEVLLTKEFKFVAGFNVFKFGGGAIEGKPLLLIELLESPGAGKARLPKKPIC